MKHTLGMLLTSCAVAEMDSFEEVRSHAISTVTEEYTDTEEEEPNVEEMPVLFENTGLPDLRREMDESACDDTAFNAAVTNYVMGTYIHNDDRWEGEETWFLFPSPTLEEDGFQACSVHWNITVNDETECHDCNHIFTVEGHIDVEKTTCRPEIWSDPAEQYWRSQYRVQVDKSHAAFHFAESSEAFGWGYANDVALNYLTRPSCTY